MRNVESMMRFMAVVRRYPRWSHPIIFGATLAATHVVSGWVSLLALGLFIALAVSAFGWIAAPIGIGILLLTVIAGAVGGAAYSFLSLVIPGRRRIHEIVRWVGAIEAYLAVFWLVALVLPLPLPPELSVTGSLVVLTMLLGGLFFGVVLGSWLYEPEDPYEFLNRRGA